MVVNMLALPVIYTYIHRYMFFFYIFKKTPFLLCLGKEKCLWVHVFGCGDGCICVCDCENVLRKFVIKIVKSLAHLKLFFFGYHISFQISIETNMDTLYWCKIFRAPILQDKHHIVGYEALLSKDRYVIIVCLLKIANS